MYFKGATPNFENHCLNEVLQWAIDPNSLDVPGFLKSYFCFFDDGQLLAQVLISVLNIHSTFL